MRSSTVAFHHVVSLVSSLWRVPYDSNSKKQPFIPYSDRSFFSAAHYFAVNWYFSFPEWFHFSFFFFKMIITLAHLSLFTINHTCSRWVDTRSTDFVKPHCGVLNVLLHFWHSNRLPVFIHFCVMIIAISRKLFFSITLCPLLLFGLIGSLNFVTTQR